MSDQQTVSPRLDVQLQVLHRARPGVDENLLRALVEAVLTAEQVNGRCELTVLFVDDSEIRRLNARHRGINRPTDVLSFPLADQAGKDGFIAPPAARWQLGDIVVSHPRAVAQATEYGHSVERELGYLVTHGLLHILGYDHEHQAQRAQMREREEAALSAVGLRR